MCVSAPAADHRWLDRRHGRLVLDAEGQRFSTSRRPRSVPSGVASASPPGSRTSRRSRARAARARAPRPRIPRPAARGRAPRACADQPALAPGHTIVAWSGRWSEATRARRGSRPEHPGVRAGCRRGGVGCRCARPTRGRGPSARHVPPRPRRRRSRTHRRPGRRRGRLVCAANSSVPR